MKCIRSSLVAALSAVPLLTGVALAKEPASPAKPTFAVPDMKPAELTFAMTTCPRVSRWLFCPSVTDDQEAEDGTAAPATRLLYFRSNAGEGQGVQLSHAVPNEASLKAGISNPSFTFTPADCAEATDDQLGTCPDPTAPYTLTRKHDAFTLAYLSVPALAGTYGGTVYFDVFRSGAVGEVGATDPIGTLAVPFALTVKHAIWLPIVVLLSGLIVAIFAKRYNTDQRILDELRVELDRLSKAAQDVEVPSHQDNGLPHVLWRELREASAALLIRDATQATAEINAAKAELIKFMGSQGSRIAALAANGESKTVKFKLPTIGDDFAPLRLSLWTIAFYVIGMFMLLYVGLNELYLKDDDFGNFADYFSLVLWGFGSQATTAEIMKLTSSWQLPGLQRTAA